MDLSELLRHNMDAADRAASTTPTEVNPMKITRDTEIEISFDVTTNYYLNIRVDDLPDDVANQLIGTDPDDLWSTLNNLDATRMDLSYDAVCSLAEITDQTVTVENAEVVEEV